MKKIYWIFSAVLFFFLVDRVSKWLALYRLSREGVFVVPQTIGFVLERNQGIAYSIPLPQVLLVIVVMVIVVIMVAFLVRATRRREYPAVAACSLIIGGALSNVIDRIRFGYVIDMIVVTRWPVFNIADLMILIGAVWLVLLVFSQRKINEHLTD